MTVKHSDVTIGKHYKFTYMNVDFVGVVKEIRDSFPRLIRLETDDGQSFGIYAAFLEEVE